MQEHTPSAVGEVLRYWRRSRGMSQLDLALVADVSARHVSFVETGRSSPSRRLLLRLSEVLDLPLRERNVLLRTAGYAHVYGEADLDADELAPARRALEFLLQHHEPYPAVVVDRQWNLRQLNAGALRWAAAFVDPAALAQAGLANAMLWLFDPDGLRPFIVNWDEVAQATLQRVYHEVLAGDPTGEMRSLLEQMRALDDGGAREVQLGSDGAALLPLHLRRGDVEMRLFSTVTTLGTPLDVTLQELSVETFFPADDSTDQQLRALAGKENGA